MSTARSNYIASVVAYSGGGFGPGQNPGNKVPAIVTHGGPTDIVIVHFDVLTEAYYTEMVDRGHFVIICRHGAGHTVPGPINGGRDWQFLLDHPFGTSPSPYAGGEPPYLRVGRDISSLVVTVARSTMAVVPSMLALTSRFGAPAHARAVEKRTRPEGR